MSLRYSNEITARLENIEPVYISKILDAKSFYSNNEECRYYMVEWNRTWESEESLVKLCSNFITEYWNEKQNSLVNEPVQRSNQQIPSRILQQLSNQPTYLNSNGNQYQIHNSKQRFINNNDVNDDVNDLLKDPYLTSQLNDVPTNDSYYSLRHQLQQSTLHQPLPSVRQPLPSDQYLPTNNAIHPTVIPEQTRKAENSVLYTNSSKQTVVKEEKDCSSCSMQSSQSIDDYTPSTLKNNSFLNNNNSNNGGETNLEEAINNLTEVNLIANGNGNTSIKISNVVSCNNIKQEIDKEDYSLTLNQDTYHIPTANVIPNQNKHEDLLGINSSNIFENIATSMDQCLPIQPNTYTTLNVNESEVGQTLNVNESEVGQYNNTTVLESTTCDLGAPVKREECLDKQQCCEEINNSSNTNPCENVTLESEHVVNVKAASECNNNTSEAVDKYTENNARKEAASQNDNVDEDRGEIMQNVNTISSHDNIYTLRSRDKNNESMANKTARSDNKIKGTVAATDKEILDSHETENVKRTRRFETQPRDIKNKNISISIGENTYERLFTIHGRIIPGKSKASNTYQCRYCDKIFQMQLQLRNHITIHDPNRRFFCTTCDYATHFNKDLKKHVKKHENAKIRECHICGYSHIEPSRVKYHMRIHFQERPFKCDQCSYAGKHQTALRVHVKNVHERVKRFHCEKCDKKFSAKVTLQSHIQVHMNERKFKCSYCTAAFNVDAALKRHELIHTNERPYHCDICNLDFNQSSSLKRHIRIHTKEKPYKCKECDYACVQSANLKYHMRKHEKKGEEDN